MTLNSKLRSYSDIALPHVTRKILFSLISTEYDLTAEDIKDLVELENDVWKIIFTSESNIQQKIRLPDSKYRELIKDTVTIAKIYAIKQALNSKITELIGISVEKQMFLDGVVKELNLNNDIVFPHKKLKLNTEFTYKNIISI